MKRAWAATKNATSFKPYGDSLTARVKKCQKTILRFWNPWLHQFRKEICRISKIETFWKNNDIVNIRVLGQHVFQRHHPLPDYIQLKLVPAKESKWTATKVDAQESGRSRKWTIKKVDGQECGQPRMCTAKKVHGQKSGSKAPIYTSKRHSALARFNQVMKSSLCLVRFHSLASPFYLNLPCILRKSLIYRKMEFFFPKSSR